MNRFERLVGLLAARRPEPTMTVARSVADVLDDHVVFEVESIDRMYLNVWQPRLAYGGGVQGFFVGHRGYHYASTALMDPMTKTFVADIHGFVAARGLELVGFAKGQRKDDLAQEFLAKFSAEEGVLFVGRAQEKAGVWRTPAARPRGGSATPRRSPPPPGDVGDLAPGDCDREGVAQSLEDRQRDLAADPQCLVVVPRLGDV